MLDDYAPYDPAELISPVLAAEPDDTAAEPLPDAPEGLPAFDPRWQESFTGMVYVGALTKKFSLLGHKIRIRTLKDRELLVVALLTKPYMDTMGDTKAYNLAVLAHALVSIDGRELPIMPLGEGQDELVWAQQRMDWIGEQYHPTVTAAMFEQYLVLDQTVHDVIEAMGKALAQPA